jgi:hypothetical protein
MQQKCLWPRVLELEVEEERRGGSMAEQKYVVTSYRYEIRRTGPENVG